MFDELDENGDGRLTFDELKKGYIKVLKMSPEQAEA